MRFVHERWEGFLRLRPADRALVRRPDWSELPKYSDEAAAIVIDFCDVEFVSSLFLEGCVELGRTLASRGGVLVLLRLGAQQKRLLELLDGSRTLCVLDEEAQLGALKLPASIVSALDAGVTSAEKRMLWS